MVLLHIKGSEKEDQFIYECKSDDSLNKISYNVVTIHNLRLKVRRFAKNVFELSKYGVMRPEEQRLLSKQCIEATIPEAKVPDADLDPNGLRIGKPCEPKMQELLNKSAKEALYYISVERTEKRQTITLKELQNQFDILKGSVMIVFPMGLPKYDIITHIIENNEDLTNTSEGKRIRDPTTSQLWFASKKLLRNEKLSKYIGSNEKTKIVVKITKEKSHMPVREPIVDDQTRKQMMAYWYKKQEQEKKLNEDDDTSYLTSEWANPNSLKQSMLGINNLKLK